MITGFSGNELYNSLLKPPGKPELGNINRSSLSEELDTEGDVERSIQFVLLCSVGHMDGEQMGG